MINKEEYIKQSLELHLFFARIMKEHSFFLEVGFMEKDSDFKRRARQFQLEFGNVLNDVIEIANRKISEEVLASGEIVTPNTLEAERKSANLTGVMIDGHITVKELELQSGRVKVAEQLLIEISEINRYSLSLLEKLINFKTTILNKVLKCEMYTANYPLLITHILNEAKMYHQLLSKIELKEKMDREFVLEQEIFWDIIMKQHAEFVRGLLDPKEKELIDTANMFAKEYQAILENKKSGNLTRESLQETIKFRAFKEAGEEGLLNCQIESIIVPLLADHILREANHFIRLLKEFSEDKKDN